jgi:hypothetical protein
MPDLAGQSPLGNQPEADLAIPRFGIEGFPGAGGKANSY